MRDGPAGAVARGASSRRRSARRAPLRPRRLHRRRPLRHRGGTAVRPGGAPPDGIGRATSAPRRARAIVGERGAGDAPSASLGSSRRARSAFALARPPRHARPPIATPVQRHPEAFAAPGDLASARFTPRRATRRALLIVRSRLSCLDSHTRPTSPLASAAAGAPRRSSSPSALPSRPPRSRRRSTSTTPPPPAIRFSPTAARRTPRRATGCAACPPRRLAATTWRA